MIMIIIINIAGRRHSVYVFYRKPSLIIHVIVVKEE